MLVDVSKDQADIHHVNDFIPAKMASKADMGRVINAIEVGRHRLRWCDRFEVGPCIPVSGRTKV
ncbi:MAG: hypothetical protein A2X28_04215 [Elusimicrobia bacterium GWA2_56_46]|nr:MAG: hypothetical protein A2X28_04215 [Elusimicrobia bacterium GWA2_56_46]OGR56081.1 MAG: hypothetical protein A2X39_07635 [Elusimicrobia bacterium GWC2_56_31]HBW22915.1 hypothetical protein [Elusimicrobiota bacterium]